MFKNYFKMAFRNLYKYKIYSAIMIFGLSVAMAYCINAFLYVHHEWSYDRFHEDAKSIYRIYNIGEIKQHNYKFIRADVPTALGPELKNSVPGIIEITRLSSASHNSWEEYHARMEIDGEFSDNKYLLTDSAFFNIFSFKLLAGDRQNVLNDINSVVISENAAYKHFGQQSPIGEIIRVRGVRTGRWKDFRIAGIVKNFPDNSSISSDYIFPYDNLQFFFYDEPNWGEHRCNTYVKLHNHVSVEKLEMQLNQFIENHIPSYYDQYELKLQPIKNIHLNPDIENSLLHGLVPPTNPDYFYGMFALCFVILCVACINYIHLSLGRISTRIKELGVRKIVGASRSQIMQQFLGESIIVILISLSLGIILVEFFLPVFNSFTYKSLTFNLIKSHNILVFIGLVILIGIVAGTYPSLLLSRYKPAKTLQHILRIGGNNSFSNGLIILQFTFSILLIISTLIMVRQLNFMIDSKTLGFKKENLVILNTEQIPEINRDGSDNYLRNVLNERLKQHSNIFDVSSTRYNYNTWQTPMLIQHDDKGMLNLRTFYVDYNYINTFQLQMVSGRNFSIEKDSEKTGSMIVTESFVKMMNWDHPIGEMFHFTNPNVRGLKETNDRAQVIGVIKDFHLVSFRDEIYPAALILNPSIGSESKISVIKIAPHDITETIKYIVDTWREIFPNLAFRYSFLDDDIANFYRTEGQWAKLITYTALFSIFIASIGVLGLVTLIATNRIKEIGIRKICGASVTSICLLLSKDFIKWIIIANFIAWPIAYFIVNKWLQNFTYRISIGWWTFVLAGVLALVIAILTASWRTIRAALANPVESLRYE